MVKIRTTGYISEMDGNDYNSDAPGQPLLFDTDDVLYAQVDSDDPDYIALAMRDRNLLFYIRMDFDAYAAIVLAGVEHLSTYGQLAG